MSQFIVYRVSNQKFAISISATSRIIALEGVTHVPESSDHMMGVMEIENEILPIIDVSKRFYNRELEDVDSAQVLVVLWHGKEIGLAVDDVLNIVNFEKNQIDKEVEKFTKIGENRENSPIQSFIRTEEEIILELDLDLFLENKEYGEISELLDLENIDNLVDTKEETVSQSSMDE